MGVTADIRALFSGHLPDGGVICESAVCLNRRLRMDTVHTAITEPVRRLEVFTGAGRRRKWSDEDKARIVAEIVASGDSVCSVARRYGLSPQQLFGWRRQLREAAGGHSREDEVQFVPAVVDAVVPAPTVHRDRKAVRKADSGIIEIEVDGITIRAGRGADTAMIASIVQALKASR
ncbi:transposase [Bradyrhizobium japonicum]|nr:MULTISPECIES: transposase [Bradyrhizobium]MDI2078320.1 transposase [Bradyrhizobium sp. Mp27]